MQFLGIDLAHFFFYLECRNYLIMGNFCSYSAFGALAAKERAA
jgi:hypothetical protein